LAWAYYSGLSWLDAMSEVLVSALEVVYDKNEMEEE